MRLALRRLAVTALLAPVAAIGVTTMIANPAEAAPAKSDQPQPGPWNPGQSHPGQSHPGQSHPGQSHPGQSHPGSWKHGGWKQGPGQQGPGHRGPGQRGPSWPLPGQPAMPPPIMPDPLMPPPAADPGMPPVMDPGTPPVTDPGTPPVADPVVPPTTDPTTPAPAPSDSADQALQAEVNRLVDAQRTSNGCTALTVNEQLTTAARGHSAWMAQSGTLSHTGDGGSTFVTRANAAGYAQPSAENIAMGYRTAAEVVDGWMGSPGHRANILNCESTTVGVGVAYAADGTPYYTQVFGR